MSEIPVRPDREVNPSTPRWVKVFGIVVIVLVLLFGILHLTGNGMGPGGHRQHVPTIESGVQQP